MNSKFRTQTTRNLPRRYSREAQRKIENAIRQKNVDENYETAMETTPEVFALKLETRIQFVKYTLHLTLYTLGSKHCTINPRP